MLLSSNTGHAVLVSTVVFSRDRQRTDPPGEPGGLGTRRIEPFEPAWHPITRAAGLPRLQALLPALLLPGESIGQ
jgi:hypothetical protein